MDTFRDDTIELSPLPSVTRSRKSDEQRKTCENYNKNIPLPGFDPRPLATVRVLSDALDHSATVAHSLVLIKLGV